MNNNKNIVKLNKTKESNQCCICYKNKQYENIFCHFVCSECFTQMMCIGDFKCPMCRKKYCCTGNIKKNIECYITEEQQEKIYNALEFKKNNFKK